MGQQIAYLKEDHIGAASRFLYGKKGEKVEVLRIGYDSMVHVNNGGILFHIRKSKLSFEAIEAVECKEEIKPAQKQPTQKQRTKKIIQNSSQQTLF